MKVTALTSGKTSPAGRFRIRQHIPALAAQGIAVDECYPAVNQLARLPGKLGRIRTRYLPPVLAAQMALNAAMRIPGIAKTWKTDALWLERSIVPGFEPVINLTKGPRLLDVDDAIWMMNPLGQSATAYLARNVDVVIAGNQFLADWYGQYCRRIHIVPTAVDCQRYRPKVVENAAEFVVGWTGTSGNFLYLNLIEEPLSAFLTEHHNARLLIVAERKPEFKLIPESKLEFIPWSPGIEASVLHKMTVGIMPLSDTPWARGKCSFKMLQYMASALPVIVSPVGMNADILSKGTIGFGAAANNEWRDALKVFYENPSLAIQMGKTGRQIAEENYSTEIIHNRLVEVFREVA